MSPRAYNFINAANKARRMLFYLKLSFATLTPASPPCTNCLSGHILNMLFKQPLPSYPATQRHWKGAEARSEVRERPSAYPVWITIHFKVNRRVEEFLKSRTFRVKSGGHLRKTRFCAWTPFVPDIYPLTYKSFVLHKRCFKKTATRDAVINSTST